jgi:flagellar hook-length control protein FliK
VLNKLGLGQSPEFLRAVYEVLVSRNPRHGLFSLPETAMQLVSAPALPDEAGKRTAEQLAPLIADLMNQISRKQDGPGHSRDVISDTSSTPTLISNDAETARQQEEMNGGHGQWQNRAIDLGQWVLNAQTQGAVGHRIGTIPFWLGNQLIEVDIAVFDQRAGTNLLNGVKHRQVVIALNMEQLGRIELTARIAGNHLRIGITADESGKTEFVSSHMGQLREALAGAGWEVDEMAYATQVKSSASGVSRSVVEHIVSQDSLNRLM